MLGSSKQLGPIHPILVVAVMVAAGTAWATRPTVLATEPANGAIGVAGDLDTITLSFSEPMAGGFSYSGLSEFDPAWEPDRTTLTLTRDPARPPWQSGDIITVTLNPPPYYSFTDLDGNPLATYAFSFTVFNGTVPGAPIVVATAPGNGAADVPVDLDSVMIEFSEPMADTVSIAVGSHWPVSGHTPHSWSADGRTLTLRRDNASEPLPTLTVITFLLNPSGAGFEDREGTPLGAYSLAMTTGGPGPGEPPVVAASDPPDGARGVGVFRDSISITFSKPMAPDTNLVCTTGNWDLSASGRFWQPDGRTLVIVRPDDGTLLPAGALISFTLNPDGAAGFRDTDGNPLPVTVIGFNVEGTARLLKVRPQDSRYDFDWAYYLWIPQNVAPNTALLVEPNNTGTVFDVENVHDGSALALVGWRERFAERLGVPLLVPTFPRPMSLWWAYTHALDNDTLATSHEGLVRIDLQLIEMIDDARERLADLRVQTDDKVLIMGFSASGQFTNRFAVLHPERTLAAAAGSPGGWPLAPVAEWQGETLNYHVGIADIASYLGHELDMEAVRAVPIFLYMGSADTNDSVPYSDAYSDEQRAQVNRLFGATPIERWPKAEAIYAASAMNATFRLYPGVGHTITDEMFDDIANFFSSRLPEAKGWLRDASGRRVQP
jgi:dienelactone hydrolase